MWKFWVTREERKRMNDERDRKIARDILEIVEWRFLSSDITPAFRDEVSKASNPSLERFVDQVRNALKR